MKKYVFGRFDSSLISYVKTLISKDLLYIIFGSFVYAVSINYFLIPTRLGEGGVTGLTTIAYYTLNIPPYLTNIVLNGIILLLAVRFLNLKLVLYSLWAVVWLSIFLRLPVIFVYRTNQTIISAVMAGSLTGLSMGILLNSNGSIAGSTILGKIVNKCFGIQVGWSTLFFDLSVAVPSVFIIGFENMLLTALELFISAQITNVFLARFGSKKSLMIISDKSQQIAQELSRHLKQGITVIPARGFYSGQDKQILYLTCDRKQLVEVIPFIKNVDGKALVMVENIRSVRANDLYRIL